MRAASIGPGSALERSSDVAWVELDGEVVVYHEPTASAMVLNTTASLLWQLLEPGLSLGSIACELAEAYEAPAEDIEHDLVLAARELGLRGLLAGVSGESEGEAS
jgi:Coenzyme PQQ synthesis protein D (PqqD)